MIKLISVILIGMLCIITCDKEDKNQGTPKQREWNPDTTLIGSPSPWELKYFITPDDTLNGLRLEYKDEMGGRHLAFGKVIWENQKTREIKITAPWIDKAITIQKVNLISDEPKIVPLTEVEYMMELKQ